MFQLWNTTSPVDLLNRREMLRVGSLALAGLSLPLLIGRNRASAAPGPRPASFGKAKNCIILYLSGGPAQLDTFDPKPDAPAEIRGEFGTIATALPGVRFSEIVPQSAKLMKHIAVRAVDTFVPRFKLEQSSEMGGALRSLGMTRAFLNPGPEGAQFQGLCASSDPEHQVSIGRVLHSAQVAVSEKGTEAAAATAVIMMAPPSARPQQVPFTPVFRADRQFVFLIRDKVSGAILFMGRVTNPAAK